MAVRRALALAAVLAAAAAPAARAHACARGAPRRGAAAAPPRAAPAAAAPRKKPKRAGGGGGAKGFGARPAAGGGGGGGAAGVEPIGGFEPFYEWLASHGATRRVAIARVSGVRGAVALEDVPQGGTLIGVPSELALDLGVEAADPLPAARTLLGVWRALHGHPPPADPRAAAEAARLAPFLRTLPPPGSADLSTPDFFSPEQLAATQWAPVQAEAREAQARLEAAARDAAPELGAPDAAAVLAELRWARWAVLSRVLTVQGPLGQGGALGPPSARPSRKLLIPLVDMCNHHLTKWNGLPSGRVGGDLKIVAARDVKQGEQVCIQYGGGALSSDRLLSEYGFVDGSGAQQELDVRLLARLAQQGRAEELLGPSAPLSETSVPEDEAALRAARDASDAKLAAAISLRLALKRAYAQLRARAGAA